MAPKSPLKSCKLGIGMVPEDRKNLGLVLSKSIGDNIVLGSTVVKPLRRLKTELRTEEEYIEILNDYAASWLDIYAGPMAGKTIPSVTSVSPNE